MRAWSTPLLALLLCLAASSVRSAAAGGDAPPEPRFDRVDHANPQAHLALSPRVGDADRIRSLASQLKADTPAGTLAAIYQWMHRNLKHDERAATKWRTLDEMLADRTYGGCADHAVVFGTLARAAGIPAIWVKTMDVDWIREFRAAPDSVESWRGHVYLEVHLDGRWRLLDASAMRLYPSYDTNARFLPDERFAYDKGDDPYDLVLSCRWELWKEQTRRYFLALDRAALPWSDAVDLLARWRLWIAGNRPFYRYAEEAGERLGYHVERTFNTNWSTNLAGARGKTLIVTCQGTEPVLPEELRAGLLPPGWQAVVAGNPPEAGWLRHDLPDGTTVILVTGQDSTSIQVQVAKALSADRR